MMLLPGQNLSHEPDPTPERERVWPVTLCHFVTREFETRTLCHAIGLYIKHTTRATALQAVIQTVCLASVVSILCIAISGHVTNNSHTIGPTPHSVAKQIL